MTKKSSTTFDAEKFARLFTEYRVSFIKLAYSYLFNMGEAEDVVNDSFLYVLEHHDTIEDMKSYLYKCVKTNCYVRLRERKRSHQANGSISKDEYWSMESSLSALKNDDLINKVFSAEVMEIYFRELDKMPELTRTVYLSSRDKDMTHQQIAEAYELSPRKVTTEMQNAYERLRIALKDYLHLFIIVFAWMNGWMS